MQSTILTNLVILTTTRKPLELKKLKEPTEPTTWYIFIGIQEKEDTPSSWSLKWALLKCEDLEGANHPWKQRPILTTFHSQGARQRSSSFEMCHTCWLQGVH